MPPSTKGAITAAPNKNVFFIASSLSRYVLCAVSSLDHSDHLRCNLRLVPFLGADRHQHFFWAGRQH
jgi:hypothetical protein